MTLLAVLPDQIAGPVASLVTSLVVLLADGAPEPEDVKAGWTAFAIFLLLAVAVAFLGRSLFKQLRKAQAAQEAGRVRPRPGRRRRDRPRAGERRAAPLLTRAGRPN